MRCRDWLHELVKEELENKVSMETEWIKKAMDRSFIDKYIRGIFVHQHLLFSLKQINIMKTVFIVKPTYKISTASLY